MKLNLKLQSNNVGQHSMRSSLSRLVAKRLLGNRHRLFKRVTSDRDLIHKLPLANVSKFVENRVGNFYPLRIFRPAAERLARAGLISLPALQGEVQRINSRTLFESNTIQRAKREFQDNVRFHYNSDVLAQSVLFATAQLFPDNKGVGLEPERSFETLLSLTNWTANSGYPYGVRKETVRDEYTNKLKKWLCGKHSLKQDLNFPCLLFNRTQVKNGEIKRRAVFGYPFIFSLIEQFFYSPILNYLKDNKVILVGKRQIELSSITHDLKPFHTYSIDYGKFDLRVDPFWIYLAFNVIAIMLNLDAEEEKELEYVRMYFAFSRIYHPHTGTFNRNRGVPSGSGGTNLIDSLVNLFCTSYLLAWDSKLDVVESLRIHGDDVVIITRQPINVGALQQKAMKLGMEIKFDESLYSRPGISRVHFLGSEWINGLPQRDAKTMSYQVATMSGKPFYADNLNDAVEGRIYSIFGYDHRIHYFWRRIGAKPFIGRRMFVYPEGLPKDQGYRQAREPQYIVGVAEPWKER